MGFAVNLYMCERDFGRGVPLASSLRGWDRLLLGVLCSRFRGIKTELVLCRAHSILPYLSLHSIWLRCLLSVTSNSDLILVISSAVKRRMKRGWADASVP